MALKITSYNLKRGVVFTNEPKEKREFVKVVDLGNLEKPFKVLGAHVVENNNAFGDSAFVCIEWGARRVNVDLPKSGVAVVKAILADDEAIAEINAGKVGIAFELYRSEKYNKDNCTSYRFCELDALPF